MADRRPDAGCGGGAVRPAPAPEFRRGAGPGGLLRRAVFPDAGAGPLLCGEPKLERRVWHPLCPVPGPCDFRRQGAAGRLPGAVRLPPDRPPGGDGSCGRPCGVGTVFPGGGAGDPLLAALLLRLFPRPQQPGHRDADRLGPSLSHGVAPILPHPGGGRVRHQPSPLFHYPPLRPVCGNRAGSGGYRLGCGAVLPGPAGFDGLGYDRRLVLSAAAGPAGEGVPGRFDFYRPVPSLSALCHYYAEGFPVLPGLPDIFPAAV